MWAGGVPPAHEHDGEAGPSRRERATSQAHLGVLFHVNLARVTHG
ncbi:hypothetical protein HMPREF9582_00668 [Cutibacterium acnes HL060PA1]|nr:hypothetical protein HMPREF9577_00614 [Cutibacterium acnes HL110PA3]EFT66373.1 hypothetical protein HMPREF9582_00668 [Cutibacterium acnes HL060PA1]EGE70949.1 hypothetical protein HMPREF9341_00662 [Cutibacterium acnes HL103PA1]